MADFGVRFFVCNLFICIIIVFFLIAKRIFQNYLTSRMQFHLWFPLLGILAVPFIPLRPIGFTQALAWLSAWKNAGTSVREAITADITAANSSGAAEQIHDFALSVSRETPSMIGLTLCGTWLIGMMAMIFFVIKSAFRLNAMKKSALPLQDKSVRLLYNACLKEMKIKRNIPVYSTAFLKSPVIVGLCKPCIYLPIHLISDFHAAMKKQATIPGGRLPATEMRYMLLHELQHYRHGDALAGFFMNLIGILYWCNPLVWYALREMRNDREIACDTSVLKFLSESDYEAYGNTLINFAEKVSQTPFPFTTGIGGSMKQLQRRIINISSYTKPSVFRKLTGLIAFVAVGVILLGCAPMLSTYATEPEHYHWKIPSDKIILLSADDQKSGPERIATIDLSACFSGYEGCFVLYDLNGDTWNIYNREQATLRTAPNSTYKIYDALFGLEEGIITAEDSFLAWDKTEYPFEAWNKNQDLSSAMRASVNWYFAEIDRQIGSSAIQHYLRKIRYGNQTVPATLSLSLPNGTTQYPQGVSPYWLQSTLKISPVEQVELLTALHHNSFGFAPEHINAVKDSICLFSSENQNFYGKTGTGRVNGQDVNGWFIGYIETADNTCFFATYIQNDSGANGSKAAEITKTVLSALNLWKL